MRLTSRQTYFYLGLTLFLLVVFHYVGFLNWAEKFLRSNILSPITENFHRAGNKLKDSWNYWRNQDEYTKKCEQAFAEIQKQKASGISCELIIEENKALKNIARFQERMGFDFVSARVIAKGIDSFQKTVIISAGANQKITVGQPVFVDDGILVGKIIKTEPDISVVRLVNDSLSKVSAMVLNKERSLGVVEGGYGLSLRMKLIPRNETVLLGDMVVTDDTEAEIPKGLVIGTVAVVENEPYKPFQQAVVNPLVDLDKLEMLGVLIAK